MTNPDTDPYTATVASLVRIIAGKTGYDEEKIAWLVATPSKPGYGDLSVPLVRFRRATGKAPEDLAGEITGDPQFQSLPVEKYEVVNGYLNIWLDVPRIAGILAGLYSNGWEMRVPPAPSPKRIVVEHTSANPIHPLHMGHARNTSIGDTLARLLSARGHFVNRRYYVDDVGKQVAIVAFGFEVLGVDPIEEAKEKEMKPDALAGWVYAVTHTILEILEAKEKLEEAGEAEERKNIQERIDDLMNILVQLKSGDPGGYFDKLLEGIPKAGGPSRVQEIMIRYEKGLEPEKSLVRRIAKAVLEGIRETLDRLQVEFDAWDWESDLVWSSRVGKLIELARKSRYYTVWKGAEAIDIPRIIKEVLSRDPEARARIRIPKGFEIPPLILVRSDGTTLYTTRDMAYTLYKFEQFNADEVVNVIGADQRLAQLQLRLALLGLGFRREALNTIHYDYEIVRLPGMRMSSRRGRIVTLDSILEHLKARAVVEVEKRNPGADKDWVEAVAEKIAVGAVRFTLVRTNAKRPVVFDVKRAVDLEENTGPYLQYTYARAHGILEKHGPIDYEAVDAQGCREEKRRSLMLSALRFPLTAAKAADDMAPEDLASYLLRLADEFNSWYQADPVIREPDKGLRECKALLVRTVMDSLGHGLRLLGVPVLERM